MESFSLLNYWKSTRGGKTTSRAAATSVPPLPGGNNPTSTTIVTAVDNHAGDSESEGTGAGDDDGPFFDLEFAVPSDDEDEEEEEGSQKLESENEIIDGEVEEEESSDGIGGLERELKFSLSSSSSSCEHLDDAKSPSDDMLFKGRIVRIDSSGEEVSSKSGHLPIPASLLRSATKFRVFMLGLKRSKSESATANATTTTEPQNQPQQNNSKKLFTVKMKFKVEEVPIISLLTRASSNSKLGTSTASAAGGEESPVQSVDSGEEKRHKKEMIQKYLKLVKPLHIRVSKRNSAEEGRESKEEKQGLNLKGMAKKHLGKSKSAVVHSMPNVVSSQRRDDSLLQIQDGIQSAILHCKRSFNSSRGEEEQPASSPCHEKTVAAGEAGEDDVVSV